MEKKVLTTEDVKRSIRDIVDFPKEGIVFKDLTTAFKDAAMLNYMLDEIAAYYEGKGITKVVGVESRGFILGTALALRLNAGFVPVRKPGKLPAETFRQEYALEYGTDTIEIHQDALSEDDIVLIHDDLLATGGTLGAVLNLVDRFNVRNKFVNFAVELEFLKGRDKLPVELDVYSLVKF